MTAFLALIAAAGIVLMIRAIVIVDRAEKVMADVAVKAREVSNLAYAIKAQNDAMLAARGIGGGGGKDDGKTATMNSGTILDMDGWPATKDVDGNIGVGNKHSGSGGNIPKVNAGNWYC